MSNDREHPVVKRPEGDMSTSSSSSKELRKIHASPDGDQFPSSSSGENRRPNDSSGPDVEYSFPITRQLQSLHINKVTSQATKPLLLKLMEVIGFTPEMEDMIHLITERSQACTKVLEIWQSQGNTRKTVKDLVKLLNDAGGDSQDYQSIINDIVNSPP